MTNNLESASISVEFGQRHDHELCIEEALKQAKRVCEIEGERFTDLRRQVLELIWAEHKPIKAYDLLNELSAKRRGVAPATVYRTLDFLQAQGLVHKLESLNAFMGCSHPGQKHHGHFLICESCEQVRELESNAFKQSAGLIEQENAFKIRHMTVEIFGICESCIKKC
ncbi:MAG: Fur family transcriptional regulator [Gammaproteobacteria bacterium]|nr:Fur family transcriptional regulator [Gammaproteobacteria bacterium]MCY4357655.1 Fur family transcriptional regulator [Gammaproteobacteria bacterium]